MRDWDLIAHLLDEANAVESAGCWDCGQQASADTLIAAAERLEALLARVARLQPLEQAAMRYAAMVRGPESWPPVEHDGVIGARARVMIACKALYEATPEGERHG